MLLHLLLGFLPVDDAIQVGEDAPHLAHDTLEQAAWNAHAKPFRDTWGRWRIRFDPRDGTPRALLGQGVSRGDVVPFAHDVARLAGVDPASLRLEAHRASDDRESWRFVQAYKGVPVEQGHLDVYAQDGRIHFALSNLHRPRIAGTPEPGEVALWSADGDWLWAQKEVREGIVSFTADGALVHRYSLVFHLDVETEERTVGDALVLQPARDVAVDDGTTVEQTGADGSHGLSGPLAVETSGSWLTLYEDEAELPIVVEAVEDEVLDWDEDLSPAASTVLHHFHEVRDWLESRRPEHPWLDDNVPARVNLDYACCNAFYTSGTINFLVGSDTYSINNLGRIADVVYHEYGHGVHHFVLEGGVFAGDISEGSADFVSATILNDPVISPNAYFSGSAIRELDTDKVYPTDVIGQVHNDGLIWGSFLWNLRTTWDERWEDGAERTDVLFLQSLSYGPTLTDVYEAVLAADDDNGDLADGTPNACELRDLLHLHGLGPGPMGALVLDHDPLGPQSSYAQSYPVDYDLWNLTEGCGDAGASDVGVWYAVDAEDPADFEAYQRAEGDVIPRQFPGAHVHYFIQWENEDGSVVGSSHGDQPGKLWSFWVGDRAAVWCEDFEEGAEDWLFAAMQADGATQEEWITTWQTGAPGGQNFQPATAPQGTQVLGTNLEGDGWYAPSNAELARTPFIDLAEANTYLTLLTMQRHLTIEDGIYDRASIVAYDGVDTYERLWVNPAAEGKGHLLDADWRTFDLDLRDRSTDLLSFGWTLASDRGLEFGGWTLDEVCVVTLDDIPAHYRVRDLVATDDAEQVGITWTNPYMQPMSATAVVRNEAGIPSSLQDGAIIDLDLTPEPGAAREVVDTTLLEGETAGYAVFVWQTDELLFEDVVEGENGDLGGVPEPEPVDSSPPEDTAPPEEQPETRDPVVDVEPRCGCGPGVAPSALLLIAGLVLVRRRRR